MGVENQPWLGEAHGARDVASRTRHHAHLCRGQNDDMAVLALALAVAGSCFCEGDGAARTGTGTAARIVQRDLSTHGLV